ncbi:MAG TPA: response regulator transcription factor [Anaerolineae bacterium]|nr:response regulator transcription factor [Anaerolineae bacterium]HMR67520.1 response regulator transcription factor [Anaerolineae bacterium]
MANVVLLIDDDVYIHRIIERALDKTEFSLEVANSGYQGLRKAYYVEPRVILLDVMMPEMDGWETFKRLREICDTPIIIFTTLSQQECILEGLNMGADDYVTKTTPFNELVARIRAVVRRTPNHDPAYSKEQTISCGSLKIDLYRREVTNSGKRVELSPTEYRLLSLFARHKGKVLSTDFLLSEIWGPEYKDSKRYLYMYISYLRNKLEEDPTQPRYICSIRKVGYRFG